MKSVLGDLLSPERLRGNWERTEEPEATEPELDVPQTHLDRVAALRAAIVERHDGPASIGILAMVDDLQDMVERLSQALAQGEIPDEALVGQIRERTEEIGDVYDALEIGARR